MSSPEKEQQEVCSTECGNARKENITEDIVKKMGPQTDIFLHLPSKFKY
jgi:hypothetical protein